MIKPDLCSSLRCAPPQKHCRDCSHAYFFGEVYVKGRRWSFEFNPQFGVYFTTVTGMPRKIQPSENHPVWDEWQKWHDGIFKD